MLLAFYIKKSSKCACVFLVCSKKNVLLTCSLFFIIYTKLHIKFMKQIAIFASGSGTNAENVMKYFADSSISVCRIYTNNSSAGVIERAASFSVPVTVFNRSQFYNSDYVLQQLKNDKTDYIILAGFLWLVPQKLIDAYPSKIINIHPALLPKYGGKGMYGDNVHKAVVANKETETGITIHLVDEKYDNGAVLFQASCPVTPQDSYSEVAQKVHELEYAHFPVVIEQFLNQ